MTWRPDGAGWAIPDVGSGNIRLLTPEGHAAGERSAPGNGPLEYVKPAQLAAVEGGFLLQDGGRLLQLDPALRPTSSVDLGEMRTADGDRGVFLLDWASSDEQALYGYSHVQGDDGTWWTGFAEIRFGREPAARRLIPIEGRSVEARFYSLANNFVASLDGRGYLLRMEERPYIVEARAGAEPRRLAAFPEGFSTRPSLPEPRAENVTLTSKLIAASKMPYGLLAWGDHLYVLTREPQAGGTVWELTKIDPRRDEVVHRAVLPTSAEHLVVEPGPRHWAILEKGNVEVLGIQKMHGLLFVPTGWIDGSSDDKARSSTGCEVRDAS